LKRKLKVVFISAVILLVLGVSVAWQITSQSGSRYHHIYVPGNGAILLTRNFGPVTNSTPPTDFQYQTIEGVKVSYVPSSQQNGEIFYATVSGSYHVIVVERGYFDELGHKYGTDYEELICPLDSVNFGFREQFIFDIWLVPFQGINFC